MNVLHTGVRWVPAALLFLLSAPLLVLAALLCRRSEGERVNDQYWGW